MSNPDFRQELFVRLVGAQKYLQETFKGTANAKAAIDKAHEINYLIKAVLAWK